MIKMSKKDERWKVQHLIMCENYKNNFLSWMIVACLRMEAENGTKMGGDVNVELNPGEVLPNQEKNQCWTVY